jgi:DNA primase small subunit
MAKPKVAEDEVRTAFVRKHFSRYYEKEGVQNVEKLENREFGVITERSGMWRHLGFKSQADLKDFMKKQVPLHAYRSSAYYQNPGARTMDEKDWLGADLIFDLDADHIKGGEKLKLEESLALVKKEFIKLVDSYLLGDFGFAESDVQIVFSGGRGYHAHVMDPRMRRLDSHQRREIVDYITATGLEKNWLIQSEPFKASSFQGRVRKVDYIHRFPEPEKGGWRGKVGKNVYLLFDEFENTDKEEVVRRLSSHKGIGEKIAEEMWEDLFTGKEGELGIDKLRRNRTGFRKEIYLTKFLDFVINESKVDIGGETDEPVTSDVKRLIRLPGSLHGKTSLIARRLTRSELDAFDPLRDGFWQGFGDSPVKVLGIDDFGIRLKGNDFKVKKGQETEMPEFAALFFACHKKASPVV